MDWRMTVAQKRILIVPRGVEGHGLVVGSVSLHPKDYIITRVELVRVHESDRPRDDWYEKAVYRVDKHRDNIDTNCEYDSRILVMLRWRCGFWHIWCLSWGDFWLVREYCDWAFESRSFETADTVRLCTCTVSCLGIAALGIDAILYLYKLGHRSEAWLEICLESCRSKRNDSLLDIYGFEMVQRVLDYLGMNKEYDWSTGSWKPKLQHWVDWSISVNTEGTRKVYP